MKKNTLRWITEAVSVIILIAAIAAGYAFITNDQQNGSQHPAELTYYDKKCQSFGVQNANLAKGQIVFIGDSITDLYILDDHYADLPLAAYNRGISGDTTEGVLQRLQVSVFDIQPSVIVLMIGTNDVNGRVENNVILQRYAEIIDRIYAALPQVELYCMSVIPQNEQLETYSTIHVAETTEAILELNSEIEALVHTRGGTYLDLFALLADENNRLIEAFSDDGLHLNVQGLTVWTGLLKPYLS